MVKDSVARKKGVSRAFLEFPTSAFSNVLSPHASKFTLESVRPPINLCSIARNRAAFQLGDALLLIDWKGLTSYRSIIFCKQSWPTIPYESEALFESNNNSSFTPPTSSVVAE
jgi:hypothetical protein